MYTVNSPKTLIENLPALLGFVPVLSFILVLLDKARSISSVLRLDLADLQANASELVAMVVDQRAGSVIAVIVDDKGGSEEHLQLAADIQAMFDGVGVEVLGISAVPSIAAGQRWSCPDGCGAGGVLDDPMSSPLAAEMVLHGRHIARRREALEALVAADSTRGEQVMSLADFTVPVDVQGATGLAAAAVHKLRKGESVDDAHLAAIASALPDLQVRDRLLAFAGTDESADCEVLWGVLARVLTGTPRAAALTLLGLFAYLRGEGPLAGVALEAALDEEPGYSLAQLAVTALRTGMSPSDIRCIVPAMPTPAA